MVQQLQEEQQSNHLQVKEDLLPSLKMQEQQPPSLEVAPQLQKQEQPSMVVVVVPIDNIGVDEQLLLLPSDDINNYCDTEFSKNKDRYANPDRLTGNLDWDVNTLYYLSEVRNFADGGYCKLNVDAALIEESLLMRTSPLEEGQSVTQLNKVASYLRELRPILYRVFTAISKDVDNYQLASVGGQEENVELCNFLIEARLRALSRAQKVGHILIKLENKEQLKKQQKDKNNQEEEKQEQKEEAIAE